MTHHQKKLAQICQLLALAKSTTFPKERESAKQMAKKLMNRYSISVAEVEKKLGISQPQRRRTVVHVYPGMSVRFFGNADVDVIWASSYSTVNNTSSNY